MSIILGLADTDNAIIMSDGRVTRHKTGEIIGENCNKTHRFNEYVIVGYSGIKDVSECVIQEMMNLCRENIKTLNADEVTNNLCLISQQVVESMSISVPAQMVIAGVDGSRKMTLNVFSKSQNFNISKYVPEPKGLSYVSLDPDSLTEKNMYRQFLADERFPVETRMRNYIKYVASIDETVNDTIFELSVKR